MAKLAAKLTSALELETRAHQQFVNISEELKTVLGAGIAPDEDEILRLHRAYDALLAAARAMMAAAQEDMAHAPRRRRPPHRMLAAMGTLN